MNRPQPERWPDFLLIGAPKAGTTALYKALSAHPQLCLSPAKEPRFFICSGARPVYACPGGASHSEQIVFPQAAYLRLFEHCSSNAKAGEASTAYLHHPNAPANAYDKIPQARLIAVLRHPVERAWSQWLHFRQEGYETNADFETAWNLESQRKEQGWWEAWYLQERGYYARQLERWLSHYPREQLLILFYEDWLGSPLKTLQQISEFLGIDPFDSPLLSAENVSSMQPRWKWLHHRMVQDNALRKWAQRRLPLWMRDAITVPLRKANLKPGPLIDPALRARLAVNYHADISRLEALTGRNLDHWRQ